MVQNYGLFNKICNLNRHGDSKVTMLMLDHPLPLHIQESKKITLCYICNHVLYYYSIMKNMLLPNDKISAYPSSFGTISLVRDTSILLGFTLKTSSHFATRAFWILIMFAAGMVLVRSSVHASDCSLRSAGGLTRIL